MMPVAEIIRLSWNLYIGKIKKYLPFIGLMFLFSALSSFASVLFTDIIKLPQIFAALATAAVSGIFYLFTFGLTIFIILYTDRFLENKKTDFKLKAMLAVFWPALCISILTALITLGGFLLLIIPGVIFTVWYAFSIYLAVLEKKKGVGALLHGSREMSRGRFWPIFGRLVLPAAFWAIIAYLVLAGIFNLLGMIFNQSLLTADSLPMALTAITLIVSDLIAAFFSILPIIATTIVYKEAKK